MASERWTRIDFLFHAALELAEAEREAFLDAECAGDEALRRELDALLASDGRTEGPLRPPSPETVEGLVERPEPGLRPGTRVGAYTLVYELASGGMGTVFLAERADEEYEQTVALKIIRAGLETADVLERFRTERQTLARLNHPNIARLLDGGATADGRPYLVMEYIDGLPIDVYCEKRGLGVRERLELMRNVCAAVQYAHQNLVVHRDLKPSNILVDSQGTPKLLDFGIAKLLDPAGRVALDPLTRADEQPMTPEYASPEQVRGESVTTATDVYCLGVILYELLTGVRPYRLGTRLRHEIERAICEEDPERPSTAVGRSRASEGDGDSSTRNAPAAPPGRLARILSGDIDTIVLTSMRKEPERRYGSADQLAEDLRRHLAGEPVRARKDTLGYRTGKFVTRHKGGVAAGLALAISLAAGVTGTLWSARVAKERLGEILRLSDLTGLSDLEADAAVLWPAHPDKIAEMEVWLARARELASHREPHEATLERLREEADEVEQARAEGAVLAAEKMHAEPVGWTLPTREEQWQHDKLSELVSGLEDLVDEEAGLLAEIEGRLTFAREIEARSVDAYRDAWDAALASIGSISECPVYEALEIEPQIGLVPLGPDPRSGLWEFAHLGTGTVPERDADGRLVLTEESGLVFVLIPGGSFWMGAVREAGGGDHVPVDPYAKDHEGPVHEVTLRSFFLAKHEMTQAQWTRFTGTNPAHYAPGQIHGVNETTLVHPVERVSWRDCDRVLRQLGLALPTEAQWEYAARAMTSTPWWTGPSKESVTGEVNIADLAAERVGAPWQRNQDVAGLDDGFVVHAPVEAFGANPFGLQNVLGNVWEWCADPYVKYDSPPREGDGARDREDPEFQLARGGSFLDGASGARSANRAFAGPDVLDKHIGVRPARALER